MLGVVLKTAIVLTVVALAVFLQPRWLLAYIAKRKPDVLFAVPTEERVVALTIDDAPTPWVTAKVLDVLRAHDAHATLFVIVTRFQVTKQSWLGPSVKATS
jgi:peptidoglycan/xylan/chitin deacetylase (PgdA/CDA1 family)